MYRSKYRTISGTSYGEVYKKAYEYYKTIKNQSKRRTYIRSKFFKKNKIFIDIFWSHIKQKPLKERSRRLRFYINAIDLIENSYDQPDKIINPNNDNELLYRFKGMSKNGKKFIVQIKHDMSKNKIYLLSVFPSKKP